MTKLEFAYETIKKMEAEIERLKEENSMLLDKINNLETEHLEQNEANTNE